MATGFITCGALSREVLAIIEKYGWEGDVLGVPALDHNHPERIAPDVEKQIMRYQADYEQMIVVFGDCGSRGALDALLKRFPEIDRIAGPHCFEMYGGEQFQKLMDEELGTFFLTDFLLRGFDGLFIKELGLDRFPQLKSSYLRNYKRVVYMVQIREEALLKKAEEVAEYLELPLEIRETAFGKLEDRLVMMMEKQPDKERILS